MRPYVVLANAGKDREAWLGARKGLLTASEVANVMGLGVINKKTGRPYTSRLDILNEKLGAPRVFTSRSMTWGSKSERPNMEIFAEACGVRYQHTNLLLASKQCPRLGATLDGLVRAPLPPYRPPPEIASDGQLEAFLVKFRGLSGTGLLEAKQTEIWYKKEWDVGPPRHYWVQVQTQLLVTGYSWAVIFCRIGVSDLRAYVVLPDAMFQDSILEATKVFWEEVEGLAEK